MTELLNIGQAAKYLNVSVDTLRLWENEVQKDVKRII